MSLQPAGFTSETGAVDCIKVSAACPMRQNVVTSYLLPPALPTVKKSQYHSAAEQKHNT